ncbi:acyltransferase family protein [Limosilactobacillus pontis]|uniref:acyltransferase family protein n=1 Tax=Limosilactobacillus pontis TaxID=35787 RepID=UPI002F25F142
MGKLGAFLFIMITGYFVGHKEYQEKRTLEKALQIWTYVFYYAIIISLLVVTLRIAPFSRQMLLHSVFPFFTNAYWFVDAYIILMLLLPYLNKVIVSFSRASLIYLIILLVLLGNVMCQLGNTAFATNSTFGYILPAYFIGAYLKKYECHVRHPYIKALALYIIVIVCAGVSYKYFAGLRANFFTDGPFQTIIATLIFIGVINQKAYHSKVINLFAKTVFAAYLITDNDYLRSTVWSFFSFRSVTELWKINLLGIPSVILLLILVFVIDQIRIYVFRKISVSSLIITCIDRTFQLIRNVG